MKPSSKDYILSGSIYPKFFIASIKSTVGDVSGAGTAQCLYLGGAFTGVLTLTIQHNG